ncbi:transcriptional regulator [Dinoroseobacter shibae DFL 12 = DSM 16493]|jgi:DNA-binding CsgD family transcriptional regulator|uniref:Transcriptional regulator n=1 Tax=Dinoroseobacter shibae (strain DSM 16493 / NCIMB 14021 / DFL 12) TaxID=398580 RepID=A8LJI2_DINSH|nr:transcriptional regulator [Dinoroseobacter shibae DFL 12 = DSM 16493]
MHQGLESFLEDLQEAKSLDDVQARLFGLRESLEVENFAYHCLDASGNKYGAMTYDAPWVKRYIEMDYARVDPVIKGTYQRFHPVDWKQLDWSPKAAREFMGEALETGVGNQGLSVPVRGPNGQFAVFSVNNRATDAAWESYQKEYLKTFILAAHFINQRALELEEDINPTAKPLSPRESDALTHLANGLSRGQVAEKLKISEHTLRVYIESARFKLGAANTTHAVARAMVRGLIVV